MMNVFDKVLTEMPESEEATNHNNFKKTCSTKFEFGYQVSPFNFAIDNLPF